MEIEARFAIPDRTTFERLRSLHTLADFIVEAPETSQIDDVYLDTEDRRISRAGYACCLRRTNGHHTVLLRKRETPDPPVHRYERLQTDLPGQLPWSQWPAGPVRDEMSVLVGDADLQAVLAINRTQERRRVRAAGRLVAELTQDVVHQEIAGGQEEFLDLVIRLNAEGTEADLTALIASVRQTFDVLPQPVSRYQRGVAVDGRPPTEGPLLTREEYRILKEVAHSKKRYARRACALIALHHGATQTEAGAYAGLTDRRVRHWLAAFRSQRLAIFPSTLLDLESEIMERPSPQPTTTDPAPEMPRDVGAVPEDLVPDAHPGPGLDPDDTMTEAARKTLHYQLLEMLAHEEATRQGGDPEELHNMRVATRRMRAAARVFKDYVSKRALKPHIRALRETARALGQVRDLDVAEEKAQAYVATEAGRGADLGPVLRSWQTAHEAARERLLVHLDSDAYADFKGAFGAFLTQPLPAPKRLARTDKIVPRSLRYLAPVVVYRRLAAVRAYDQVVTDPEVSLEDYHNLRIATKRLRYTLEFFEEILGPEVGDAIRALKRLQDYLGDLQDAVVASDRLRNFWLWEAWDVPAEGETRPRRARTVLAPGVARYHAEKQMEIQVALDGFADFWQQFQAQAFSELVAKAVSVL